MVSVWLPAYLFWAMCVCACVHVCPWLWATWAMLAVQLQLTHNKSQGQTLDPCAGNTACSRWNVAALTSTYISLSAAQPTNALGGGRQTQRHTHPHRNTHTQKTSQVTMHFFTWYTTDTLSRLHRCQEKRKLRSHLGELWFPPLFHVADTHCKQRCGLLCTVQLDHNTVAAHSQQPPQSDNHQRAEVTVSGAVHGAEVNIWRLNVSQQLTTAVLICWIQLLVPSQPSLFHSLVFYQLGLPCWDCGGGGEDKLYLCLLWFSVCFR